MLGWGIARGKGGGSNANGSHVAQKLGKTRQNGPYGVFRGPPIPTYTPAPKNRATAVLTPLPGITASAENPDSPSRHRNPHELPHFGWSRFNPGPVPGSCGRHAEAQKPRTRRGLIPASLSDYAGCIVLNASGIFRLSHSINRRVHLADPPRARRHHPNRVPP